MLATRLLLGVFLATLVWPAPANATTYLVRPDGTGDFQTIQAAIDVATTGDSVLVDQGLYEEHLLFRGHDITLMAIGEPHDTIVRAVVSNTPLVWLVTPLCITCPKTCANPTLPLRKTDRS